MNVSFFEALGMVSTVAMASDYQGWTLADIEECIVPALQAGQCKIYFEDGSTPVAFVTWALVDDECHSALSMSGLNPSPGRWNSGNNLWFIDIVSPSGKAVDIIRDLQRNHFPNQHAHSIKRNPDGSVRRVKVWRNSLVGRPEVGKPVGASGFQAMAEDSQV